MEIYLGVGFVFLCLAILVGIVGIVGYKLYIDKEKIEISPVTEINQSNNTTNE